MVVVDERYEHTTAREVRASGVLSCDPERLAVARPRVAGENLVGDGGFAVVDLLIFPFQRDLDHARSQLVRGEEEGIVGEGFARRRARGAGAISLVGLPILQVNEKC